ncbi:MAG: hypothetical protein EBR07_12250 [Planctomycetes bacterium]|nr:hypothetical protein [Planctomycetota bacterium]
MRAGVRNAVERVQARKVGACRTVEGIVNELHARETEPLPQRSDGGRHGAKVLGHQRQSTARAFKGREQFRAGRWTPGAVTRGACRAGNFIRVNEPDKVINAQRVKASKAGCNAGNPPRESGTTMLAPSVVRMTPQLARGTKTIGRNSSDHFGATASVEAEQARIVLDVCGI